MCEVLYIILGVHVRETKARVMHILWPKFFVKQYENILAKYIQVFLNFSILK